MCAITGDHVYFITEASLQICICILFDPIWKPDAVVVESGLSIEIVNNKARHNLINSKCRWRSDQLDGAGSFREPLSQTIVMQICQRETQIHQGAIIHEVCCLAAQLWPRQH